MPKLCVCLTIFALQLMNVVTADAQTATTPNGYREIQLRKLEMERNLLVAMADSMPERYYRDRATPAQRDFAQQIHHAASSVSTLAARFVLGVPSPERLADTTRVLNSKTEMVAYVNRVYDWATRSLREQSDQDRGANVSFFGQNMPRWEVWDEIHEHTIWTAGAVVGNFRKHGMAPPGFAFF
jgi:DinB superfamily